MIRKQSTIFLFSVFLLLSGFLQLSCHAQTRQLTNDQEDFIKELEDLLDNNLQENEGMELDSFRIAWTSSEVYQEDQKQEIIRLTNLMLAHRARPNPHLLTFIEVLNRFRQGSGQENNFAVWTRAFDSLLNTDKVYLSVLGNFLSFSFYLLDQNSIYHSSSRDWTGGDVPYRFLFSKKLTVEFNQIDLKCFANRDSIVIFNTSGVYSPDDNTWKGRGGLVTWERAGYARNKVSARLEKYTIDLSKTKYTVDSVSFTNTLYFDRPILGKLEDQVMVISNPNAASYPRFESNLKEFSIKNLFTDINYQGGFSMQGSKLIGSGTDLKKARLYLYKSDTLRMLASSKYFVFGEKGVSGPSTEISIYLDHDSIYHQQMSFDYVADRRRVTLSRNQSYGSEIPFSDSYHKVDITCGAMVWDIDQPKMEITMPTGSVLGDANFRSFNFFNFLDFERLQGMDDAHPLMLLRNFAKYYYAETFPAEEFAKYIRRDISTVRNMLMRMAIKGFIYYDFDADMIEIRPKLYDYINAALSRIDFDVLNIVSKTKAPVVNATLDMSTFDMDIHGVDHVFVSDSQNVVIYPASQEIILKHNRNFQFDGQVDAGLFTFYGKNLFFAYDTFKINLQNIDSVKMRVITDKLDNFGHSLLADISGMIENVTGELIIDKPFNKSGRVSEPAYPIFKSRENSYVYFNNPDIQGGVYPRDKFYFRLNPYVIDSLDNFKREGLNFEGTFMSAGIFPPIDYRLKVQPDYSMGFIYNTTETGLPAYEGKGQYFETIDLSNKGLRGRGKLDYLNSTVYSQNFMFYPDSTNAQALQYVVRQQRTGVEYPDVNISDAYVHWLPKEDKLLSYQKKNKFSVFNDSITLAGSMEMGPRGITADGLIDMRSAEVNSNKFLMKANSFTADSASFNLKSLHSNAFTVLTDDIRAAVDFDKKTGRFDSNKDFTFVQFPENKYVSYLDYFVWQMDSLNLKMGASKKSDYKVAMNDPRVVQAQEDFSGALYVSTDPAQDSLSFVSPVAKYNYRDNVINASGVEFIPVADAMIYPKDKILTVKNTGLIKTLEDATIVTNSQTKYHTLYAAMIDIKSRYNYSGSAYYDYIDELGQKEAIHFSEIRVDTSLQTIASGEILEPDDFTLSPNFAYQGKVFLNADQKFLTFDGATKIAQECPAQAEKWLAFRSDIDPDDVEIPISSNPVDINFQKVYAGTFLSHDSIHVYSSFLSGRKVYNDSYIVTAQGFLRYNKDSVKYEIASKEKLTDWNNTENYLSLGRNNCTVYGEGKVDLGIDLGQLKLKSYGNVTDKLEENEQTFDLMLTMDFFMSDQALAAMASEIDSIPGLQPADIEGRNYTMAVNSLVGKNEARRMKDEMSLYGAVKSMPQAMLHTVLFTNVHFKWNQQSHSYQSYGKIGIGNIMGQQVNRMVDGMIEITHKRSGDEMDVYLDVDGKAWYYFGYTRGVMQTQSSNQNYVNIIKNLSNKDRRMKVHSGQTSYIYMLATDRKYSLFRSEYLNRDKVVEPVEEELVP